MRAVALVVAVVMAVIGVGVALVPGVRQPGVPAGWVALVDKGAQIAVPGTWKVAYNEECGSPVSPGIIYIDTRTLPVVFCAAEANLTNAPEVYIYPAIGLLKGMKRGVINDIPVWRAVWGGDILLALPSLGVTISASGPGVQRVLDTLTTAPA